MAYGQEAFERLPPAVSPQPSLSDRRSSFARDRDRILYSSAFRKLAGKTQVVSAGEMGLFHNRLTHSLKVAQLGRRLAEQLRDEYMGRGGRPGIGGIYPTDPDLVESACFAHDLGHPPFGHVGEEQLDIATSGTDELHALYGDTADAHGGFEGNAQSFRTLTYLAVARDTGEPQNRVGLNLTRATLDASVKYPRTRAMAIAQAKNKWGAYELDAPNLEWVRLPAPDDTEKPCFEAELMDWCDDVTYAVHDLVDFYRAGHIPLRQLFAVTSPLSESEVEFSPEAERFLEQELEPRVAARGDWNMADVRRAWKALTTYITVPSEWRLDAEHKAAIQHVTSRLISFFTEGVGYEGDAPCRYDGNFVIHADADEAKLRVTAAGVLKWLLRIRVIEQPAVQTQQRGSRAIVRNLFEAYITEPNLLPLDRCEEYDVHRDLIRVAADQVAGLPEAEAIALHRRICGIDLGLVTDLL